MTHCPQITALTLVYTALADLYGAIAMIISRLRIRVYVCMSSTFFSRGYLFYLFKC